MAKGAEARDDWEYWSKYEIKKALHKQWDLKGGYEAKFQDDLGNFYLTNGSATLLWKPEKFLELGPGYKYEYTETSSGKNTDENRLYWDTILKASYHGFSLNHRHRVEWRNVSGSETFRWRGQLKVSHPLQWVGWEITPFVAEEIFWNEKKNEFDQNRLTLGVGRKLSKEVALDLFYLLRSDRTGSDWNEREVIGTELKLSF